MKTELKGIVTLAFGVSAQVALMGILTVIDTSNLFQCFLIGAIYGLSLYGILWGVKKLS